MLSNRGEAAGVGWGCGHGRANWRRENWRKGRTKPPRDRTVRRCFRAAGGGDRRRLSASEQDRDSRRSS